MRSFAPQNSESNPALPDWICYTEAMIYCDNAATTMTKPPEVIAAVAASLAGFGNPGRASHGPSMEAARTILAARTAIADLVGLANPLGVAFTSGATESLNLVVAGLVREGDHVIASPLEHNSVLRPLYRSGCRLSFIPCDDFGRLILDDLDSQVGPDTGFLFCTHGSNLSGSLSDIAGLKAFAAKHGLTFVLDVSQTVGCTEVRSDMADILCFTGHKALYGPQGTGGIIVGGKIGFRPTKTGGSGSNSFDRNQSREMPDVFEAGTPNAHGLAGLAEGAAFVAGTGIGAIRLHGEELTGRFLSGIRGIPGIRIYGEEAVSGRLPIVALNLAGIPAWEAAEILWEKHGIATRAGSHCAPLAHLHFGTEKEGMLRFSFGYHNTAEEVEIAVKALGAMAGGG